MQMKFSIERYKKSKDGNIVNLERIPSQSSNKQDFINGAPLINFPINEHRVFVDHRDAVPIVT